MNSIAVYNFKGGVGKTTTTINLGFSWSKSFKVLLIDMDPQCNLTNALMPNHDSPTIHGNLKNILHNHPFEMEPCAIHHYLHLIPGHYQMAELESNNQFISFGHEMITKQLTLLRGEYDFVLIDCPTNFGVLVKSILNSAKSLLVPAIADSFSVSGIQKLLAYLAKVDPRFRLNILGIFFNMHLKTLPYPKETMQKAKEIFGNLIINQTVSRSSKIGISNEMGLAISSFAPDANIAREFEKLSDELLDRIDSQYLQPELIDQEELARLGA